MLTRIRPITTIHGILLEPYYLVVFLEDSTVPSMCRAVMDELGNYILIDKKPPLSIDTSTVTSVETYAEMHDTNEEPPMELKNSLYLTQSNAMDKYETIILCTSDEVIYHHFYTTLKEIIRINYNKREPSVLDMVAKHYYRLVSRHRLCDELTPADVLDVFNIKSQTNNHTTAMVYVDITNDTGSKIIIEKFNLHSFFQLYLILTDRVDLITFLQRLNWDKDGTAPVSVLVDFYMDHQYPKYSVFRNIDLELLPTKIKLTNFFMRVSKKQKLNERLTRDFFVEYLMSNRNISTNDLKFEKHDMNQPLNHYYINSSHNTYLPGWQVNAKSAVEMYRQTLLAGCRCIELDCWDGPQNEPIITHGYALCSTISFKEVLRNIKKYAFKSSEYPVILSLENHCSLKVQANMARYLKQVLGDLIQWKPFPEFPLDDGVLFPPLEECKGKIFIKNNKISKGKTIDVNQFKQKSDTRDSKPLFGSSGIMFKTIDEEDVNIQDDAFNEDTVKEDELGTVYNISEPRMNETLEECNDYNKNSKSSNGELCEDASKVNFSPVSVAPCAKRKLKDTSKFHNSSFNGVIDGESTETCDTEKGKISTQSVSSDLVSETMNFASAIDNPEKIELLLQNSENLSEAQKKKLKNYLKKIYACRNEDNSAIYSELDSKGKIHPAMSDMVNYFRPCPFTNMSSVLGSKFFLVCTSFNETAALNLEKNETIDFVELNKKRMARIYPKGGRYESTNYNPQTFWNAGCHMVALNYQTSDVPMQLNKAKFEVNNGTGYVLKPSMMVESTTHFDPHQLVKYSNVISVDLSIRVLSAQFVSSKKVSVFVNVELFGLNSDISTQKTNPSPLEVTSNVKFNVGEEMIFKEIIYPPHVIVRFSIVDDYSKVTLYQRCVHLESLEQGLRHIPMKKVDGRFASLTTLCVIMDIKNFTSEENEAFANLLAAPNLGVIGDSDSDLALSKQERALKTQQTTANVAPELSASFFTELYGLNLTSLKGTPIESHALDINAKVKQMRDQVKILMEAEKTKLERKQNSFFRMKKKPVRKSEGCSEVSRKYKSAGDSLNSCSTVHTSIDDTLCAENNRILLYFEDLHQKDAERLKKLQESETEQLTKAQREYYVKSWKQCKKTKGLGRTKAELSTMKKDFERDIIKSFYKEKSWLSFEHKKITLNRSKNAENDYKMLAESLSQEADKVINNAKLMKKLGFFD